MPRSAFPTPLAALAALVMVACADAPAPDSSAAEPAEVVVYSGRNESLIGPLLARFEEETGFAVKVRYGETAELAATILEEGSASPADVFIAQDAAALGAVGAAGLLVPLEASVLDRVEPRFRSHRGNWVGLSGRARSVVYNTERLSAGELPGELEAVTDPKWRGRFGIAPTNGSFQAHMAVYRLVEGEAALDELLAGMVANEPQRYPKNSSIVEAVIAGEVDWGLVNHYYLWRALQEQPDAPAANAFMAAGAASGFVNVAGVGLLDATGPARRLIAYLLAEPAQRYFAESTFEYPLAAGVEPAAELPSLAELASPELDFGQVAAVLEDTLRRISESGLVE